MIKVEKIIAQIQDKKWEELLGYLDEIINRESQSDNMQKHWLVDYKQEKLNIIQCLTKTLNSHKNSLYIQNQQLYELFEQCVVKLFSKGLILPQFSHFQDINLLTQLLSNSNNAKYLFMLFQQNLCQIKLVYHSYFSTILDKVYLKLLSIIPSFLYLIGQVIFEDVVHKFNQFYTQFDKVMNQQNVIEQPDKNLHQFMQIFHLNSIHSLHKILTNQNKNTIQILKTKQTQRYHLFNLIKLIYNRNTKPQHKQTIYKSLNFIISQLNLTLTDHQQLPSFWIANNLSSFVSLYHTHKLLQIFGNICIKQLPSRPQFSKISNHLLILVKWVCQCIYFNENPIDNLSVNQNKSFFIQLFQRFAILLGLLNKQKQDQNEISMMINGVMNKKRLFSNWILSQILWRELILKHEDMNFKKFCMNQYKKIFTITIKQIQSVSIHVLNNGYELIYKLVSELQGNSNAQYIGFHITLVGYYLGCLKRVNRYKLQKVQNNQKNKMLLRYYLSEQNIVRMKQRFKQKLNVLRQSLKDRLQVQKMKNENNTNENRQNQLNQVSICIYRIQSEINFND